LQIDIALIIERITTLIDIALITDSHIIILQRCKR
jgi:hypothetical protein